MRLSIDERAAIREVVLRHILDADVYLFGSRTNDAKRGGDIDLLIIGKRPATRRELYALRIDLIDMLGEQKIDVLYQVEGELTSFAELALMDAKEL